jgi:hypothetical protein
MYLPFVEGTYVSEAGVIASTLYTKMQTAGPLLFNATGTGSTTGVTSWYLLHRAEPGDTPPLPTQLNGILATDRVATQRRRLER